MEDENVEETVGVNKAVAVLFAILAFIEVGLLIVYAKLLIAPEFYFSKNGLIRIICLILCYIVAHKFYNYLTDGRDDKTTVMMIFMIIFIITLSIMFI